ncbi:MAG: sigma 54-interacting transcriptional regulator [Labilithrix sp.]
MTSTTNLVLLGPMGVTVVAMLPNQRVTIGRDDKASEVAVRDRQVSRRHLEVRCSYSGAIQFTDLGSHNGTFLDGAAVEARSDHELPLRSIVTLGQHHLWGAADGARWLDFPAFQREVKKSSGHCRIFMFEGRSNTSTETSISSLAGGHQEVDAVRALRDALGKLSSDARVTRLPSGALLLAVGDADAAKVPPLVSTLEPFGLEVSEVPQDTPAPASVASLPVARGSAGGVELERVAVSDITVLILGETGAGKEVIARHLHSLSKRAANPFVVVNCAAIAESLFESELFGHERGAFTGANVSRQGYLESANGGSVLLDEVGELSNAMQAKLLRVLETRTVHRVGSVVARPLHVRFMAATLRDLPAEVAAGRFREDLYFRLCGVTLRAPPLRERRDELAGIAEAILQGISPGLRLTDRAVAHLLAHSWPGNVRELKAVLERALLVQTGAVVDAEDLLLDADHRVVASQRAEASARTRNAHANASDGEARRTRVVDALQRASGNQRKAAEMLGISRRTLTNWLNDLGLPRPRKE